MNSQFINENKFIQIADTCFGLTESKNLIRTEQLNFLRSKKIYIDPPKLKLFLSFCTDEEKEKDMDKEKIIRLKNKDLETLLASVVAEMIVSSLFAILLSRLRKKEKNKKNYKTFFFLTISLRDR